MGGGGGMGGDLINTSLTQMGNGLFVSVCRKEEVRTHQMSGLNVPRVSKISVRWETQQGITMTSSFERNLIGAPV